MASLSNTLFMIPRELPSYLKVAYSLRYADEPNTSHCLARIYLATQRVFALIKEILFLPQSPYNPFQKNREKLEKDFELINQTISENQKPICVYFVSNRDHNGAILGNSLYYYHHYKIQGLQKHFAVAPRLVSSQNEMKDFMTSIKGRYANRQIKFVDVVTHGGKSSLGIHPPEQDSITPDQLEEDLFSDCATDATILLDACITGLGDRNIADEIARKTPGRKILAPGPSMFFSKPVIRIKDNNPQVVSAVHGFAVFNAYECKSFSYSEKMATQYPYVRDTSLQKDIESIASSSILRNAWLDWFLKEDRKDLERQIVAIYNQLSDETKIMVEKKICENQNHPVDANDNFGKNFLRKQPLHASVRAAFRSIFDELIHEVREYPVVKWAKLALGIENTFQVMKACFRTLTCREAIAPL